MKKIININLSGRVIPIEDSAYEKLQAYIESLRRYFANEEGRDEIINDIESRVAELMSEKIRKGATVITDADIDEIALSMGRPEDFAAEAAEPSVSAGNTSSQQNQQQQQYSYSEPKQSKGRLYRDTSDKFVAGVCSGIANYLNVDPTIVRILFAIITFGGFGLGFLAYILLWIILPQKDLEGFSGKRLYRNPDDRIIGGVAGGLAAYFDKRVSTIRLIFAAPLVLSILIGILRGFAWDYDFDFALNIGFGSLSGTFILAYIILWMVLPEARTNYEKMEMRGEKVDVNRIRQNVREGMGNMKDRVKTWTEEVKESAQNFTNKAKEFSNTRGKAFAAEVSETARTGGRGIGHAIGVLFKVFFLFIAGTIAFGLFVGLIALIFGGVAWWPINNFLWTSKWQQIYAWGTVIFFLGIPLIAFITWIFRRLLRVRSRNSYLGWTFGALWTVGWVSVIAFASSITKDFREQEHTDTPVTISQPKNGKMTIAVSQPELEFTGSFGWMNDGGEGWNLSDDTLQLSTVRFDIKASTDSAYHVTMKRYSFGRSENEALNRAEKIQYTVIYKDSVLDLGNGYAIDKDSKFRGQQVEIEILVPPGKKIRFDKSVNNKLNPTNIRVNRSYRRKRIVGIEFSDDNIRHYRSDVDYTMGVDGNLKDSEGNTVTNDDYRYSNDRDSNRTIEEQRRKVEKEQERLKQMEEKKTKEQEPAPPKTNVRNEEKSNEDNDTWVGSPSPIFSMIGGVN